MKKYLLLILLIGIMLVMSPYILLAQEVQEKTGTQEKPEEKDYSYGRVTKVDVAKNEIVVSEYDWETNQDIAVTYSVAPDAKFENVASLKEVEPDTEVSIEYIEENGKKIVKFISIHKVEPEPKSTKDVPETPDVNLPEVE